jgi:hypothetical protein
MLLRWQRAALPHQHEKWEHYAAAGQQIAELAQLCWERR